MNVINEDQIRRECFAFLQRKGHGALTDLANASGLSAESVRKVRQGTRVDLQTLMKVDEGLRHLGWYTERHEENATGAEDSVEYSGKPGRPVTSIFAAELRLMAEKLETDSLDLVEKGQELREFIANLHKTVDAKVAAIEKLRKGEN